MFMGNVDFNCKEECIKVNLFVVYHPGFHTNTYATSYFSHKHNVLTPFVSIGVFLGCSHFEE